MQQGDPLGPLLFSLVLDPMVKRITRECPSLVMNAWYLDDGLLMGPVAELGRARDIILADGPALGLGMNLSKCEVWWPTLSPGIEHRFPGMNIVRDDGITLLGCPVGAASHADAQVRGRVRKIETALDRLVELDGAQAQGCFCGGPVWVCPVLPLRSAPAPQRRLRGPSRPLTRPVPGLSAPSWEAGPSRCGHAPMPASLPPWGAWECRPQPLALPPPSWHPSHRRPPSSSAFCGSRTTFFVPDFAPALAQFITLHSTESDPISGALLSNATKPQKWLSAAEDRTVHARLWASADVRTQAMMRSAALPYAGAFITLPPGPGWQVPPWAFRMILRFRLGLPLVGSLVDAGAPLSSVPEARGAGRFRGSRRVLPVPGTPHSSP